MSQITKTKQIILQSRNDFETKYINRDKRFFNNEESVKSIFEGIVRSNLKKGFPYAKEVIVVPNHQINFKKGVIRSFVSPKPKNFNGVITETRNGPISIGNEKDVKSEHVDSLIRIVFKDNTEYNVIVEFKHRNKLNSKGKTEGRDFQEKEAIIKDLERVSSTKNPNNYSTDSGILINDFMFIFITDKDKSFVKHSRCNSRKLGYSFEFGEGVVKEFNGNKFEFKYKQIQNVYFLNFDSF
tara:strand:+ start:75 stop:794 length:720 start_codon:yes stop_codon:yes gene_type:complete